MSNRAKGITLNDLNDSGASSGATADAVARAVQPALQQLSSDKFTLDGKHSDKHPVGHLKKRNSSHLAKSDHKTREGAQKQGDRDSAIGALLSPHSPSSFPTSAYYGAAQTQPFRHQPFLTSMTPFNNFALLPPRLPENERSNSDASLPFHRATGPFSFQQPMMRGNMFRYRASDYEPYMNQAYAASPGRMQRTYNLTQQPGGSVASSAQRPSANGYTNSWDIPSAFAGDPSLDEDFSESFLSILGLARDRPRFTEEDEKKERARLTDEEAAAALSDMFGKHCTVAPPKSKRARKDLDSASVEFLVRQMRVELEKIPRKKKWALAEAQAKCKAFEFSDERLEQFLRREGMNTKLAAQRFVNYWESRLKLFGPDKFLLPMTLSEALCDDLEAIEDGVFSLLPHTDASGRNLLYTVPGRRAEGRYSSDSMLRALWYVMEILSWENRDINRGYVSMSWNKTTTIWDYSHDRKVYDALISLEKSSWPNQCVAHHACLPSSVLSKLLRPVLFAAMLVQTRIRVVTHDEEKELVDDLSQYGVLKDMIPTEMGGTFVLNRSEWMANRRALEMEEL